jgi:hypothetical protein
MSRIFKVGFVGLVVVSVMAVFAVGGVLAANSAPSHVTDAQRLHGPGRGFGRGGFGQAGLEAAAGVLGMSADELSTQLWGGRTLAELADKAGVDLQAVRDAVDAARQTAMRDAIEQAVTDGMLSREQADWMLQGLDNGYLGGGFGRGFGHSFGGFRGAGGLGRLPGGSAIAPAGNGA